MKSQIAFSCFSGNTLVYGNDCDSKGIYLYDGFLKKQNREDQSTKAYDVPSDYCLTGQREFMVNEAEVFQIIYE